MSQYKYVTTEQIGQVGLVAINRPEAFNALNYQVTIDIVNALKAFDNNSEIGCMVLTGGDKAFCAGADLKWIASQDFESAFTSDLASEIDQVAQLRKPVIAAVHGVAFGGGTEISLMCDMVVADPTAKFSLPEVTLGVIPGAGGPARLTRAIGKAKAMEYILTGKVFDAQEAEHMGVITKIVEEGKHIEEAIALATLICNNPRMAVLAGKESVNQQAETPLQPGLKLERRLFHALFGSQDQREGMTAFAEKRKPNYKKY
ncbi:enoyl-CoA hydratase-related protein [Vibrio sp. 10N.261.51.F12]|uniref:enoyl-CoA hydratase-related protein n=1 Tax=Vibrio sp. 10N.261.51.F12 TaxID=3229679 RepID=UPI00354B80C4